MAIIDPRNGRTKRDIFELKNLIKSLLTFNLSDNGVYFIGLLTTGDLFLWNKDKNTTFYIQGSIEFTNDLITSSNKYLFINDDAAQVVFIKNKNKIFVWQIDAQSERCLNQNSNSNCHPLPCSTQETFLNGFWYDIMATTDFEHGHLNIESTHHARFNNNQVE
jgi:hypothetical protein